MNYKCDSCIWQIITPPSNEEPHGAFYCACGHWNGNINEDGSELQTDPWKWCKDYKPNI